MEFAYLDESGDPGAKGSKKIVMCLVCTKERKKLNKLMRKTKQDLLRKKKTGDWLNRMGEIKFYSFPDKVLLKRALKELAKINFSIYCHCFTKNGNKFSKAIKHSIMGQLFWHIFERSNKIKPRSITSDLDFFGKVSSYFALVKYKKSKAKLVDDKGNKIDGWQGEISFREVSKEDYEMHKRDKDQFLVKVEPRNSRLTEELQAVDLICGSIFQYVENGNKEYFEIIKDKIVMIQEFKGN